MNCNFLLPILLEWIVNVLHAHKYWEATFVLVTFVCVRVKQNYYYYYYYY